MTFNNTMVAANVAESIHLFNCERDTHWGILNYYALLVTQKMWALW